MNGIGGEGRAVGRGEEDKSPQRQFGVAAACWAIYKAC